MITHVAIRFGECNPLSNNVPNENGLFCVKVIQIKI